jgi:hypothetical protein
MAAMRSVLIALDQGGSIDTLLGSSGKGGQQRCYFPLPWEKFGRIDYPTDKKKKLISRA